MYRIGQGYDVHAFSENRDLILGGVKIPHERGLLGHSDADVLTHAIMDSVLGSLALGDIGQWFPDTDPTHKGADSLELLKQILAAPQLKSWVLGNLDATIIAQKPKLAPFIPEMRQNYAKIFACDVNLISIKATTTEKLGFCGREEGMAANAVLLLRTHS